MKTKYSIVACITGLIFASILFAAALSQWTTQAGALADGDFIATTDVSDVTQSANGTSKKITWLNFKASIKTYTDTLYAAVLGADDNYVTDAEKVVIGNTSNTNSGDEPAADLTTQGIVELATGGETVTGTDATRAVTPDGLTDKMAEPGAIGETTPGAGTFTAVDIVSSPAPTLGLKDSDSLDADETVATISANATTVTAGAVVSDLIFSYKDGGDASGVFSEAFRITGATNTLDSLLGITAPSFTTTGVIKGRLEIGADITGSTSHDTSELHNTLYMASAAATITLDAAADAGYGSVATYWVRDAAEALLLDPQAGEKMRLEGLALAVGVAVTGTGIDSIITIVAVTDTDGSGTDGYLITSHVNFVSE